jgi:hypothetical protein
VWNSPRRDRRSGTSRRPREPLGSSFIFLDRADAAKRRNRIDQLGRGLRRIRTDLESCRRQEFLPGKQTRVRAGRLAYLDLLLEACDLLEVEHRLDDLRGIDQQLEILRVEDALSSAGLRLLATG